jgi:hypothetical protein
MARQELDNFQESFLKAEKETNQKLAGVRDPALSTKLADGRTMRRALQDLAGYYTEHIEQLLWTKWVQGIERSESRVLIAGLQAARASFNGYASDLDDEKLVKPGHTQLTPSAEGATAKDVLTRALEEERRTMDLITQALNTKKD